MPIEFRCPSCDQQLRVPDTAAGKNAKCPKCQTILAVPASSSAASPPAPLGPPPQPGFSAAPPPVGPTLGPPFGTPPTLGPPMTPLPSQQPGYGAAYPPGGSSPFGDPPGGFEPKPAGSPFGDSPFASAPNAPYGGPNVNPYAAPQGGYAPVNQPGPGGIGHQIVDIGPIINHSLKVWQENLGILIAVSLIPMLVGAPIGVVMFAVASLAEQNDSPEILIVAMAILYPIALIANIYLGIGQLHVMLKLARLQKTSIGEMFVGFDKVLPVLGFVLLAGIVLYIGLLLCIVPGVILLFMYWPSYFLVIDGKTGVMDSFGKASTITQGNHLTTFLVYLCGAGFVILGYIACGIGLIFAMPLVMLMWCTAYLMMSGQLPIPNPNQPVYR